MPYKVVGNKVMHYKNGKWSVKQTASSHENAIKAVKLLHGIEHGMKSRHHSAEDGSFLAKRMAQFLRD